VPQRVKQSQPLPTGVVVVLTATIDPRNTLYTARRDVQTRLKDYETALRSWLSNDAVTKLVFCENSGFDLAPIREICANYASRDKQVEIVSFRERDFNPTLGKGFGEMGILSHVAAHSQLFASSLYMMKITGRLYVSNARELIRRISSQNTADVFCNVVSNLTYTDSRVFCCNRRFLDECFLPIQPLLNESLGFNFEKVLARAVHRGLASGMTWSLLPVTPRIHGIGGTFNEPMNSSLLYWLSRECFRQVKAIVLSR
jgi:hypothetical protein